FLILMFYFGFRPGFVTLLIIPVTILFVIFTFSFALVLSCFNVYFRDVEMFWTTITPALFYATPVVYAAPERMGLFLTLNPFAHFMELIRAILYKSQFAKMNSEMWHDIPHYFLTTSLITLSFLSISLFVYNKLRKGFISNF
ncbi:MAG TPA: hypothetical protein VK766_10655, partial [Cytophagaceae bacterium]|nr:hypothetical protein [Cytophagaceae bacterium]